MEYLKFILYGLIQGSTEFIPISSTAHLKIISSLLGIDDPGSSLSAIIQFGSVFALFWYFREDLFNLGNICATKNHKYLFYQRLFISILIGTIPFLILGGAIKIFIPNFFEYNLRSNFLIAIISLLMSIFMFLAEISKCRFTNIKNHKYWDSLLIGLAQTFAIIPGVSRSGITISTALMVGWERKDAAKYSFLLGIPAISLAAIVEFFFSLDKFIQFSFFPLLVGLISTFISSLLAIDFLIKFLSSNGMKIFIYYRLFFGIFILLNL